MEYNKIDRCPDCCARICAEAGLHSDYLFGGSYDRACRSLGIDGLLEALGTNFVANRSMAIFS